MSLPNAAALSSSSEFPSASIASSVAGQPHSPAQPNLASVQPSDHRNGRENDDSFIDRRRERTGQGASERRQFGSSHEGLSEAGRELALAIDQYKLQHHRRYITCDEMLLVITRLGYTK